MMEVKGEVKGHMEATRVIGGREEDQDDKGEDFRLQSTKESSF